jgi:nucleoside-diphosphate-sugar epimerase
VLSQSTIIVVGGAGFVGSNLVRALLSHNPRRVIVVDNLLSAERSNLPDHPAVQFVEGSITDDAVLARLPVGAEYVFHLATFHGNQNSIADPLADHENNTLTTLKLCERLKQFTSLKRVVYSSAGCTVAEKSYDDALATREDAPVSLWHDSPYQISKIIGELYFNYYFARHRIPAVKARFQNVYGAGEILGAGQWRGTDATIWRNVTPVFIYRALKGMKLPVDNGGIATRDFIHVDDIVAGLIACALQGKPGEVYNLASGVETSILDLANAINSLAGNSTGIDLRPPRDWDRSGKRFGSTEKASRELGFACKVGLEDGLRRTVAWTRDNFDVIEGCIARHARKAGLEIEVASGKSSTAARAAASVR